VLKACAGCCAERALVGVNAAGAAACSFRKNLEDGVGGWGAWPDMCILC